MELNKDDFFRQVTALISSSLDMQTAMQRCFEYLQAIMGIDSMVLVMFEPDSSAIRFLNSVGAIGSIRQNMLIPLSPDQRALIQERLDGLKQGQPKIQQDFPSNPLKDMMLDILGPGEELPASALDLYLSIEHTKLAILSLSSKDPDAFSEEHIRLLASINDPFAIAVANAMHYQEMLRLKNILAEENQFLRDELNRFSGDDVVGSDFGLKHIMEMVRQVAGLNSPVLLLGETGVGKDVIANVIHNSSFCQNGPFIKVNCGAIPDSLIDSELFGHEKGAFTGAFTQKRGRFERADGGSIFLDEIAELPMHAQIRLLRVLQSKEIERVGGTESIPLDIRVITATNRDLEQRVKEGKFREDLWFRLNVFPICIPPLRERAGDIPALVHHFVEKKSREMKRPAIPELEAGSIDLLTSYSWPGNVRELENMVERALILHREGVLSFRQFLKTENSATPVLSLARQEAPMDLNDAISMHIKHALEYANGKIGGPNGAAELLGMNTSTLRNKMKKLGIPFKYSGKNHSRIRE